MSEAVESALKGWEQGIDTKIGGLREVVEQVWQVGIAGRDR
jgi:hypothetical protein